MECLLCLPRPLPLPPGVYWEGTMGGVVGGGTVWYKQRQSREAGLNPSKIPGPYLRGALKAPLSHPLSHGLPTAGPGAQIGGSASEVGLGVVMGFGGAGLLTAERERVSAFRPILFQDLVRLAFWNQVDHKVGRNNVNCKGGEPPPSPSLERKSFQNIGAWFYLNSLQSFLAACFCLEMVIKWIFELLGWERN